MGDRIAQTVVKMVLEPLVEPHFHGDSFGYRPGKSALDAVGTARKRCWRSAWVIDLDIKEFFESLDHDLVLRAVWHHTNNPWVCLLLRCMPNDLSRLVRLHGRCHGPAAAGEG